MMRRVTEDNARELVESGVHLTASHLANDEGLANWEFLLPKRDRSWRGCSGDGSTAASVHLDQLAEERHDYQHPVAQQGADLSVLDGADNPKPWPGLEDHDNYKSPRLAC
jgi:hypothetical protein